MAYATSAPSNVVIDSSSTIPLSLYVHIPWCERKCPYCDFNSHVAKTSVDEAAYVAALLQDLDRDLERYAAAIDARPLQSIFIGGGTPSLFSPESIAALLSGIRARISCSPEIEITLEANPGSAEADRFIGFQQAGVNRLSIGVQSFNDKHLNALGRVHNRDEAIAAAEYAVQAGLNNFNLDLMFGLPAQDMGDAVTDLEQALQLNPSHLSCYQLTIEPNTLFHHHPPVRPDDETLWAMQSALQERLAQHGFNQYEVSAYARDTLECDHNLNYWQFGDYLGIGAGAHGKLSDKHAVIQRNWKVKHPASYQQRCETNVDPAGARTKLANEQVVFEFMLNALRLSNGFEKRWFGQRTGRPISLIDNSLSKHESLGLLEITPTHIKPSDRGKTMIDTMLEEYLP